MLCMKCGRMETLPDQETCDKCERQNADDLEQIAHHIREGHTSHCAKRQAWGDGECECNKENVAPGFISALITNAMEGNGI